MQSFFDVTTEEMKCKRDTKVRQISWGGGKQVEVGTGNTVLPGILFSTIIKCEKQNKNMWKITNKKKKKKGEKDYKLMSQLFTVQHLKSS